MTMLIGPMAGIGHISLQDHGDKVEFKRVAVRHIK